MNKRKIALLAMSACMIAILAIGGTLAYFTDNDTQTNVFTTGDVKIDLYEDFGDNDGTEKLVPSTMVTDKYGKVPNGIDKEIYVKNTGSEDAWVRIHFAIPKVLDDGQPSFKASENTLHWNITKGTYSEDMWDWTAAHGDNAGYNAESWNYYEQEIGGIQYHVYVATYGTPLKTGEATPDAIHQVYLDAEVTNENITALKQTLGDEWKIIVSAEGMQYDDNFDNGYDALDAAFGKPGTYNAFNYTQKGDVFKDVEGTKDALKKADETP